jgi:hypothetical protein
MAWIRPKNDSQKMFQTGNGVYATGKRKIGRPRGRWVKRIQDAVAERGVQGQ